MYKYMLIAIAASVFVASYAQNAGTFTDSRDGKTYKTVKIGTAVWMAENLNFAAKGSKCYDNKDANCAKFGRLYNWAAAQKACPAGYRLPTDDEWTELADAVGGSKTAGTKLKSAAGWNGGGNGTNDYGWSALPGGNSSPNGHFDGAGNGLSGAWWSGTEYENGYAWSQRMVSYYGAADRTAYLATYLLSVRCVEDNLEELKAKKAAEAERVHNEYQRKLQTDGAFTDSRDGKVYMAVKIGKAVWMAENLNYAADGSKCHGNSAGNCETYGRLYNWASALKACPAGYHLPTDDEWTALTDAVGGEDIAGAKLKSAAGWKWDGNGTNDYGWSALPGGNAGQYASANAGVYGGWWSATESNANFAWSRYMTTYNEGVSRSHSTETYLFSVRCVQD